MLCLSTKLFLFGELGTDMWDYLHNERIANTEFVQKILSFYQQQNMYLIFNETFLNNSS